MEKSKLIAIAAVSTDGVIGVDNEIPWRIPEDFKHFRETTMGHTLIVGLNTYLTLPDKAFEGRKYIVLYPNTILDASIPKRENVMFCNFDTMQRIVRESNEVFFVAGGAMVYETMIDYCDEALITWVNKNIENGNKLFPIDKLFTNFTAVDDSGWVISKTGIKYKIRQYIKHIKS